MEGKVRRCPSGFDQTSMTSRERTVAPPAHLPLRRLAVCLDCDECFGTGPETCPACGSETWTSLSRFLERAASARRAQRPDKSPSEAKPNDEAPEMVRQLVVVARNRENLYEHLKRAFAGNGTVRVVLNQRVVERRARNGPCAAERRQGDRRLPFRIDGLLRAVGWVVVPQAVPRKHRGSAR
ncbi:MAG: hypothetical protein DMD93_15290 [Candidatus Rokuibacteriota bacterium]|nr:MAG: hypothetical protein DMD93_15290 [Candidatus Rokubacteria bacterium]